MSTSLDESIKIKTFSLEVCLSPEKNVIQLREEKFAEAEKGEQSEVDYHILHVEVHINLSYVTYIESLHCRCIL